MDDNGKILLSPYDSAALLFSEKDGFSPEHENQKKLSENSEPLALDQLQQVLRQLGGLGQSSDSRLNLHVR